jgi:hypothetical protein
MNRILSLGISLFASATVVAQEITITGGQHDASNVLVRAKLPADLKGKFNVAGNSDAHFAKCGLSSPADDTEYFTFFLRRLNAGETVKSDPDFNIGPMSLEMAFAELYRFQTTVQYMYLVKDNKPLVRFVNPLHDDKKHDETFKPFHHVFAPTFSPVKNPNVVTGDVRPNSRAFPEPHDRGLCFGFNKITYGNNQEADIWNGTEGVYSQCDKILSKDDENRAFGRLRAAISWHGRDGKTFAEEERETTVHLIYGLNGKELPVMSLDAGILIDWVSVLTTKFNQVQLGGDPDQSGFFFRAATDVSQRVEDEKVAAGKEGRNPKPADTYFLRPDGKGKPGETRNGDPKSVDLPWAAMCFISEGKRYTVLRINHPDNPKKSQGVERDFGRFGDSFQWVLTPKTPLRLKYRLWVQEGEMTLNECEAMVRGFVDTPKVEVK